MKNTGIRLTEADLSPYNIPIYISTPYYLPIYLLIG